MIARPSETPEAPRALTGFWIAGAVAALLIPILAASGLAYFASKRTPKYAGIEIGSTGPRYCVIEYLPPTKGGANYRFPASKSTATRLTEGMDRSGTFDAKELARTVEAVKSFYDELLTQHKIPAENIAIVCSVGVFGPIAKRKDLDHKEKEQRIQKCRAALAAAVKEATGQSIEIVGLRQITEHELKACVRKSDLKDAVFIDIGGGSTRGGYSDTAGLVQDHQGPGISIFMDAVNDGLEDGSFVQRAGVLSEEHLRVPFRTDLGGDPEFKARKKVYLAGGTVWVMANCQRPEEAEDYVSLSAEAIATFAASVRSKPDMLNTLRPEDLSTQRREWFEQECPKMRSAFKKPNRLVAGAEILHALSVELKFADRDLWFYRHSDYAWIASYMDETRRSAK